MMTRYQLDLKLEGIPAMGYKTFFVKPAGAERNVGGSMVTGPTAMAFSLDPVAAAKVCVEFANKNDKLTVIGGALGEQMLDPEGVKGLAKLPSLDELRGTLVGLLQAPATKLAGVTQAPAGQLARVFSAYGSQGEAA